MTLQAAKTERLLNLVIALLAARRPLTIDDVQRRVAGYDDQTDDAFHRMFERDKAELRNLGVPLETVVIDPWTEEQGYTIRRDDYELPEVVLAADEAAAVGLAVRFWRSGDMSAAVSSALRKLRAAGVEVSEPLPSGLEPIVDASDPALLALWDAVRDRSPVRFGYRTAGSAEPVQRQLEPWGVASWHGRWYVGGHDRDRGEARVFRLDRVVGGLTRIKGDFTAEPPGSVDIPAMVEAAEPAASGVARVHVKSGRGYELRRVASSVEPGPTAEHDLLELPFGDLDRTAQWIAGFGADAVVVEPPALRAAVVARLRAVAGS